MGQMVESLDFPAALNPATIAIFSVSQSCARIITGVISEAALKWKVPCLCMEHGIPRPFFLVVASAIAFFSHIMLASATDQVTFVFACAISGLAFGMAWPLMVLIVSDIYGLKYHGANYMMYDGSTKAFGTIFLSQFIAGGVYESHVDRKIDEFTCYGLMCFRETHLIVAFLALTSVVTSFGLMYTAQRSYENHAVQTA